MNEPTIQITGTACADSEIRYTPTGKPVTHLTVACNPRRYDQTSGQWLDGTATFWPCQIWGGAAERVVESVKKGDRVILTGRVKANVWTPTEGEHAGVEQRRLDLIVEEIGCRCGSTPPAVTAAAAPAASPTPAKPRTELLGGRRLPDRGRRLPEPCEVRTPTTALTHPTAS